MCIILFCYTLDYLSQANVYLVIQMITDLHVATLAINTARPPVYYSTKSFRIMSFFEIKGSAILWWNRYFIVYYEIYIVTILFEHPNRTTIYFVLVPVLGVRIKYGGWLREACGGGGGTNRKNSLQSDRNKIIYIKIGNALYMLSLQNEGSCERYRGFMITFYQKNGK